MVPVAGLGVGDFFNGLLDRTVSHAQKKFSLEKFNQDRKWPETQ